MLYFLKITYYNHKITDIFIVTINAQDICHEVYMNYISNTINKTFKNKYHKDTLKIAINMAWPAIIESFFIAFAGLIDSLMVSSLGSASVAAVGLTTQPKLLGLALFLH